MSELDVTLILGVLSFIATIVVAWISAITKSHAKQINDAVNNRHSNEPKLYDLALRNAESIGYVDKKVDDLGDKVDDLTEWKDGYKDSPLGTGPKLEEWLKENSSRCHDRSS